MQCAGRQAVLDSWKLILGQSQAIQIRVERVNVCVNGDLAFVTCEEYVDAGDSTGSVAATNVFERQSDQWRIVHHQGGPVRVAGN